MPGLISQNQVPVMESGINGDGSFSEVRIVEKLEGKLVTRSMAFKTREPRVLLQFENAGDAEVLVEVESDMLTELQPGASYRLTHLQLRVHKLEGAGETTSKFVLRPTQQTTCMLVPAVTCWCGPSLFTSFQGMVTNVFPPLAMYELDESVWLCLAYVWGRVELRAVRVGSWLEVWNAHCIDDCLVLCERGSVSVTGQDTGDLPKDVPRPLQWLLENWQLGFKDALWLMYQYHVLKEKFRRLLSALPPEDEAVSIDLLLVNLVKNMEPRASGRTLTLKEVFLDHDERCCIQREGILGGEVYTVAQLAKDMTVAMEGEDWKHRRTAYGLLPREVPLVCRLSASCGHLLASDDTGGLPLLVTGAEDGCLPSILGFVVVVSVCVRIVEVFRGGRVMRYLQARLQDIMGALDVRGSRPILGAVCPECSHVRACHHACPSLDALTLTFHLQHKTSVIMEDAANALYCHLLGSLQDRSCKILRSGSAVVCLSLLDELVPLEQVLSVGGTYVLRLPSGKLANQTSFPDQHYAADGSAVAVVSAFQLPQDVSFKLESFESLVCQRVEDALRGTPRDELHAHSLRGVVVTRRHQEPHFPSEQVGAGVGGYGIPGPRVMILTLRDDGGLPSHEMTIYTKNWRQLKYPLGMLPGATIVCRRLIKKVSDSGRSYYVNDRFTLMCLENLRQ